MYSKVSHMMQLKNCIYIANGVAMAHLGKAHINRNYVTMEIDKLKEQYPLNLYVKMFIIFAPYGS
jgi:hypothetical protein